MRVARAPAPITTLCCVRRIGQYFEPIYGRPSAAVSVGELNVTKVLNEVMAANARYADEFGDKAKLPMPPGRRFAILTCMDARLDPAKFAGLAEGDAHVIRNAGGRASDDAIRSLVISHKLLGTREWFVIHHTDCGMETFTDEIMRGLLASSLETASIDRHGLARYRQRPGLQRGTLHRLAHHRRQRQERGRGRGAHPQPPAGQQVHTGPRLHLRREERSPHGGGGGERDRRRPLFRARTVHQNGQNRVGQGAGVRQGEEGRVNQGAKGRKGEQGRDEGAKVRKDQSSVTCCIRGTPGGRRFERGHAGTRGH
jgi:hypothetical protein